MRRTSDPGEGSLGLPSGITGRRPVLPNLLIIGAQKCATTSLHLYLASYPEVWMSEEKELDFFGGPGWKNWERGLDWYEAQFPTDAPIRGESSPSYTAHPFVADVPERIRGLIPDCKMIYIVRDPVERLISHYMHVVATGKEHRSIEEIWSDPDLESRGPIARSRYAMQLERYLEQFPAAQILVVQQEELLRDTEGTLRTVFRFLGVSQLDMTEHTGQRHHGSDTKRRSRWLPSRVPALARAEHLPGGLGRAAGRVLTAPVVRPTIDVRIRRRVEDLLRADAMRLRTLTGKAFAEWSI